MIEFFFLFSPSLLFPVFFSERGSRITEKKGLFFSVSLSLTLLAHSSLCKSYKRVDFFPQARKRADNLPDKDTSLKVGKREKGNGPELGKVIACFRSHVLRPLQQCPLSEAFFRLFFVECQQGIWPNFSVERLITCLRELGLDCFSEEGNASAFLQWLPNRTNSSFWGHKKAFDRGESLI